MILEPISSTFLGGGTCRYGANFRTWAVRGLSVQPFDPFEANPRGRLLDPLAVEAEAASAGVRKSRKEGAPRLFG